jgi:hypothetical protein
MHKTTTRITYKNKLTVDALLVVEDADVVAEDGDIVVIDEEEVVEVVLLEDEGEGEVEDPHPLLMSRVKMTRRMGTMRTKIKTRR